MKNYWLTLSLLCLAVTDLSAQTDLNQSIPMDSDVRIGVLENGLTYYIKKNSKPENRVELRLVVNAGSILEDDDQQGLAHFVEHMAFNGTKNFAKNELVDYLQSVGVKFGPHLNAYTSFDETVYELLIPTDTAEILDKGLQILEDWAHNITFDSAEIEKERGVVIEEWRRGLGASKRMRQEWFPIVFEGSRYAERLPIGKKKILETFSPAVLERFYKDWYRPDLMAIVVVGDIDPDEIEVKIKKQFGKIPAAETKRERSRYDVPIQDKKTTIVTSDPETQFTVIQLSDKRKKKPFKTLKDYRRTMVYQAFNGMLNNRLDDLTESSNPPFMFAGTGYRTGLGGQHDQYSAFAIVSGKGVDDGLRAILEEQERVRQHRFTQAELTHYIKEMLSDIENAYKERDNQKSSRYTSQCINHFLRGSPIISTADRYAFVREHLPKVTLDEINGLIPEILTSTNRVLLVTTVEKKGQKPLTEAELDQVFGEVSGKTLKPYKPEKLPTSLMKKKPTPGKVVKTERDDKLGTTRIILSNGLKVVMKPTDFKNDEILMTSLSRGGTSLYGDDDQISARYSSDVVDAGGVGKIPKGTLEKFLADKQVFAYPYVGRTEESIDGECNPEGLETMLQLTYLYFTSPRKDKKALKSLQAKNNMLFEDMLSDPETYFREQVNILTTQNHPRRYKMPTPKEMASIKLGKSIKIYKERFANASDFTFYFVGNFEVDSLTMLLETYLGSLPSVGAQEDWRDEGIRPPKGMVKKVVKKGSEDKSQVRMIFRGDAEYSMMEDFYLNALGEVLDIKLTEKLREEKSGVYSLSCYGYVDLDPYEAYNLTISFPCSPENVDTLIQTTLREIQEIQLNGPTDKDLQKVKEAQLRELETERKENDFWLYAFYDAGFYQYDPREILKHEDRIKALTAEDIQRVAKQHLNTEQYILAILKPEKDGEK